MDYTSLPLFHVSSQTGTLTEDGLDMWGIIPYEDGLFGDPELEPSELDNGPLMECLATCHSLTLIEGVLSGDPLDLKMFQSTKWVRIVDGSSFFSTHNSYFSET